MWGFAYVLTPKMTIPRGLRHFSMMRSAVTAKVSTRGGFNQATNIIPSLTNGQTYQETLSNLFPRGLDAPRGAADGLSTFIGRGVSYFDENPLNPYMQRWSFSLQRELPSRVVFETMYVWQPRDETCRQPTVHGNAGTVPLDAALPGPRQRSATSCAQVPSPFFGIAEFAGTNLGSATISRANLLRPYPQFSGITANVPTGYSYFHSLQTQVEKRYEGRIDFPVSLDLLEVHGRDRLSERQRSETGEGHLGERPHAPVCGPPQCTSCRSGEAELFWEILKE